jgi:hypothetical protein
MKVITNVKWSSLTASFWLIYWKCDAFINRRVFWLAVSELFVRRYLRTTGPARRSNRRNVFNAYRSTLTDGPVVHAHPPHTTTANRRSRNGVTDSLKRLRQQTSSPANNSSASESTVSRPHYWSIVDSKWYTRWPCRWTQPVVDESWGTLCWSWSLIRHLLSFFLSFCDEVPPREEVFLPVSRYVRGRCSRINISSL